MSVAADASGWVRSSRFLPVGIALVSLAIGPDILSAESPSNSPVRDSRNEAPAVDGATEWAEHAQLASQSLLLDAVLVEDEIVAVGDRGHILISADQGQTWDQSEVPTRRLLSGICAIGDQIWVAGHDALILHSDDRGATWTERYSDPEEEAPLFDIWFETERHGFAFGAYGLFLETTDAGDSWERHYIGDEDPHFYGLTRTPNGVLYLAGEFGSIYRSDDDGTSWIRLDSPYGGTYFGILALDDESVLVFGLRGHLYRSVDRGTSWARVETRTHASILGGLRTRDGSVVLVGLSGLILVSQDRGKSFELRNREDRIGTSTAVELDSQLLLVGESGAIRIQLAKPAAHP